MRTGAESQEERSHGSCRVGKGEMERGCHVWSSPAFWAPHPQSQITMSSQTLFFREKFYIFVVSLIFNVQTFFLRLFYFAKEISDVFGSKRASEEECIFILKLLIMKF